MFPVRLRPLLAAGLFLSPLAAHDLYLMPAKFRSPGAVTIAFHNGDDFPVPDRPPKLENVLDTALLSSGARLPMAGLRVDGKVLRGEVEWSGSGSAIVTARTRPNLIELAPAAFKSYLEHEGLSQVLRFRSAHQEASSPGRERYSKYVKSILGAGPGFDRLAGFPIEIVPESDPSALRPGAPLPIRVLFRGQPAPDLQIEAAWLDPAGQATKKIAGRTDSAGRLSVPIAGTGTWKLHTVLMERCADVAAADWESFWASLTFEVRQ